MRILKREKIAPISVAAGDSISLTNDGKPVLTKTITRNMVVDEAIIFEPEPGEFPGIKDGIGGLFGVAE